jgi:hypothetical protein
MTEPTHLSETPRWFVKHYADQFFLPQNPQFEQSNINLHANFYHYQHPHHFDLDIDWVDFSTEKKPKSYLKSIQKTKEELKDSMLSKKLQTKLKMLQTKQDKLQTNKGKVIKTLSVRLELNHTQKNTIIQWIHFSGEKVTRIRINKI